MTPLLTAQDVAERLGVSKDWVWAQARAGAIPHVRLGRYRRFRAEAIEAWIVELETSNLVGTSQRAPRAAIGIGGQQRRR
jgi:excisionase family DNA binding protein